MVKLTLSSQRFALLYLYQDGLDVKRHFPQEVLPLESFYWIRTKLFNCCVYQLLIVQLRFVKGVEFSASLNPWHQPNFFYIYTHSFLNAENTCFSQWRNFFVPSPPPPPHYDIVWNRLLKTSSTFHSSTQTIPCIWGVWNSAVRDPPLENLEKLNC